MVSRLYEFLGQIVDLLYETFYNEVCMGFGIGLIIGTVIGATLSYLLGNRARNLDDLDDF